MKIKTNIQTEPMERFFQSMTVLPYCRKDEAFIKTISKMLDGDKINNLLLHLPIDYLLYHKAKVCEIQNGDCIVLPLLITKKTSPSLGYYRVRIPYKITCESEDGTIKIEMLFFKMTQSHFDKFEIGKKAVFSGKLQIGTKNGKWSMTHPQTLASDQGLESLYKIERLKKLECHIPISEISQMKIERIVPIYRTTKGISQYEIRRLIQSACKMIPERNDGKYFFKKKFITEITFDGFLSHLADLHFPFDVENIEEARKSLAETEFWITKIILLKRSAEINRAGSGISIVSKKNLIEKALRQLLFELTKGQQDVLDEIFYEQAKTSRMSGLLQGDVGSGKTIVAVLAILNVVESGMCGVFMAPTGILARQHYEFISDLCFGMGLKIELLTGATKQAEKRKIVSDLRLGVVDILIGTHSLINDTVEINNAGIFVVDEQQNFGVNQRTKLFEKANKADILMMSATPIPRTLAMSIYGDMRIFSIMEKPKNRKDIVTSVVSKEKYSRLIKSIKEQVEKGAKVYWICPLVEAIEELELIDTETRKKDLKKRLPEIDITVVHGKMKQSEKEKSMSKFKNGDVKILIATTAIEVGVDVKDATIIVIENAEQFGLSQLHQLRGRVGRGNDQSYCVLMYDTENEISKNRLDVLKTNNNGFQIAEEDLKNRGSGNIAGEEQSGYNVFKFIKFSKDIARMQEISKEIKDEKTLKTNTEISQISKFMNTDEKTI